jgi:hypothetical protein
MRPRALTALCVLALLISACGSDGGSAEPTGDLDNSSANTTAGSADTDTPSDEGGQSGSEDDSDTAGGLPSGGSGTVILDGETIEPAWVGNCQIDEQFDPQPGDLDVDVSLDGGLEALFLGVSVRETRGVPAESSYTYTQFRPELQLRSESGSFVSYEPTGSFVTGPDGTWYLDEVGNVPMALAMDIEHQGVALDQPPIVIDGNNLSGAVTFEGSDGPVEVTFDLTITEAVDCSL